MKSSGRRHPDISTFFDENTIYYPYCTLKPLRLSIPVLRI